MATDSNNLKDIRFVENADSRLGRNGTNFEWKLTDYKWHNNSLIVGTGTTGSSNREYNIPFLRIDEIQPDYAYNYGDVIESVATSVIGEFGSLVNNFGNVLNTRLGSGLNTFGILGRSAAESSTKILKKSGTSIAAAGARLSTSGNTFNRVSRGKGKDGIIEGRKDTGFLYDNFLSAEKLGTYELPYMSDMYLETVYDGWSQSGTERVYGKTISKFMDANTPYTQLGVPEWTLEQGGVRMPSLKVEFNLYNRTIKDLINNYHLLYSLASGALWLQYGTIKKSPNLFHVSIPGRFSMPFSSMKVEVKTKGMIRKLNPNSFSTPEFKNPANHFPLLSDSNAVFPDVFAVTLHIQSLLPNNFNTFLLYTHGGLDDISGDGPNPNQISITDLARVEDSLRRTITDVGNTITGLKDVANNFLGGLPFVSKTNQNSTSSN